MDRNNPQTTATDFHLYARRYADATASAFIGTSVDTSDLAASQFDDVENGDVHLFIGKFSGINDGKYTTADMWVLTESDYTTLSVGGITEAELNTLAAAQQAHSTDLGDGVTFTGAENVHFAANRRMTTRTDELRIATTLDHALGVNVPEPASLSLLAFAATTMLRRRRV